jgi:protease-4
LLVTAVAMTSGCITIDLFGGGEQADLVETVIRGRDGKKILLLDIDGVIGGPDLASSFFGSARLGSAARVVEMLDRARQDDEVAAVLLRIDSPGGTATASEQVYEEILRFKRERQIPIAAQFMGTATSGAYYVAMAADTIQAHPTTVTGSIGVIFTSLSFVGLMEKLGVEDQTLTGGEFKDAGSPFKRLSATERQQLQAIVDDLHGRFREIVGRGRPELSLDQIATLARGQVFSARQALENGLVDTVGSIEDVVRALERRLGVARSRVVSYHRPREIRRNLYTRSPAGSGLDHSFGGALAGALGAAEGALALQRLESQAFRPGFHYLWWPGVSWPGVGGSAGLVSLSGVSGSDASSAPSGIPLTNIAD